MKKIYILQHWIFTLLLGSVLASALSIVSGHDQRALVGALELYPIFVIVSIVVSLPTMILYVPSFYLLSRYEIGPALTKTILILISIIGIFITMKAIGGSISNQITVGYCLGSLIIGAILKIEPTATSEDKQLKAQ